MPWEFGKLTPQELFDMLDGHQHALSDLEEMVAHYTAVLANTWGARTTTESLLGRPLRRNWEAAMAKKQRDEALTEQERIQIRLQEKDAERRLQLEERRGNQ